MSWCTSVDNAEVEKFPAMLEQLKLSTIEVNEERADKGSDAAASRRVRLVGVMEWGA